VEGRGAFAKGKALDEGQYLRLCKLTGGIHEELHAARAGLVANASSGRRRVRPTDFICDYDDDYDLANGDWTVRRVRRLPGGTVVVTERDTRPRAAAAVP